MFSSVRKFFAILFIFCLCFMGKAQVENTGLWLEGRYAYQTSKEWEFSLEPQLRFDETLRSVNEYITSLNITKKINAWEPKLELRYAHENDLNNNVFDNFFRYRFSLSYEKKFNFFEWNVRLGHQNKKRLEGNRRERKVSRLRSKFKFDTEILAFSPALFTEYLYAHGGTQRNQLRLGVDWAKKMGDAHRVTLRYMAVFYPNNDARPVYNVIKLAYGFRAGK